MIGKKKKIIFLLFVIILMSGETYFYANQKEKNFNPLNSINSNQIQKLIDNTDTGYIYIGRPTCEECQEFLPKLRSVLIKKRQKVFYYNTDNARKENQDKLVKELNNLNVKIVPTILYMKKGKIDEKLEGSTNKSEIEKFLAYE
ncbi:thioredoxin family protein [Enterococcus sp. DIV0660C]|uniref:thioredoxin domain-containing protein n=1 Tax=Enterococcus sp. DIV0660C TaxID=2230880 RepID=UPI001A8CBFEE|nr:thioredoxin family protein [Enterococcus sp. DIV0660C]